MSLQACFRLEACVLLATLATSGGRELISDLDSADTDIYNGDGQRRYRASGHENAMASHIHEVKQVETGYADSFNGGLRGIALMLAASETMSAFTAAGLATGIGKRQLRRPMRAKQQEARGGRSSMISDIPFNDGPLVYGSLHAILAAPTLTLLALSPPLQEAKPVQKRVAYAFIGFIIAVGVFQSFIWDSYGATQGFWEFNPIKCTLRDEFPLPLEEILWLFHHVTKTALYQLKAFELVPAQTERGIPSPQLRASITFSLVAASLFGVWGLGAFGETDSTVKCIALVCAFFAPVWLLIWQIGSQFVLRHADRVTWGWLAPGITTVLIDCLGQQQGVWRFPDEFLSGISYGYLKLDIVLVYMVSTFAVTGTGAIILAAAEELLARREAEGQPAPNSILDVWQYIFQVAGEKTLQVGEEGEVLAYESVAKKPVVSAEGS